MTLNVAAVPRRRLMAVMLVDVVDYSRMMSRNEDETHVRITRHVDELVVPTISKFGGRLVRSMGDGLLVEFVSAVDAVTCALDIQRGLAARQANEPAPIRLRIGINTGDVLRAPRPSGGIMGRCPLVPRRSPLQRCALPACAACWSTAPIISAVTRLRLAGIRGQTR